MTEYDCKYCQKQFSRAWNRDRHMKDIHERYRDKDYNPRILERNKSYQKEPTYHTDINDVGNIL